MENFITKINRGHPQIIYNQVVFISSPNNIVEEAKGNSKLLLEMLEIFTILFYCTFIAIRNACINASLMFKWFASFLTTKITRFFMEMILTNCLMNMEYT